MKILWPDGGIGRRINYRCLHVERHVENRVNSGKPKADAMAILSQVLSILRKGAEINGEV